jgi:hypothetical protein
MFLTLLLPSSSSVSVVRADSPSMAVTLLAAQYSSRKGGVAAGSADKLVNGARLRICCRGTAAEVQQQRYSSNTRAGYCHTDTWWRVLGSTWYILGGACRSVICSH